MPFTVFLTNDAERDLEEVADYIALQDGPTRSAEVLARIESAILGLEQNPLRGVPVRELLALGVSEFREVFFKPYRVIYRVAQKDVYVHLVADGRRDMTALLQRRLLRA